MATATLIAPLPLRSRLEQVFHAFSEAPRFEHG
jgi:hypothetical protein